MGMSRVGGLARFVIIHGAFGGGWEWTPVAKLLGRDGHEVWTPTLTGLGDRAHLGNSSVGLGTHILDLVSLLETEDLRDVVLCGASYGGMPATGAADRVPERLAGLVYVDGLVPNDGQSALDLLPASLRESVRARAQARGSDAWTVPVPEGVLPPRDGLPAERWSQYVSRLVPQPAATFSEAIRLTSGIRRVPRGFVRCTKGVIKDDPIEPMGARARRENWPYREIATPHDPHLFDPQGAARVLVEMSRLLRSSVA